MLSPEQLAKRGEIGASDIPIIVNGDDNKVLEKWQQLVGLVPPPDLSRVYAVQKGSFDEPFNLDWHQVTLGYELVERGEVLRHPELDFVTCTLDAYDPARDAVVDCKSTQAPLDWVRDFYAPQLLVQRACRGAKRAILLVSAAGREPVELEVEFDQAYYDEILARVRAFKICMETMTPPVAQSKLMAPGTLRSVDLENEKPNYRQEMIDRLEDWRATFKAYRSHEQAAAAAKSLVPQDVGRLLYQDIRITRDKRGVLSLRSTDPDDYV